MPVYIGGAKQNPRLLAERGFTLDDGNTITTPLIIPVAGVKWPTSISNNSHAFGAFYIDPAEFGARAMLSLATTFACNTVACTRTITVGLYPVASVAGAVDLHSFTVGTIVTGSACVQAGVSASTQVRAVSSDFALPTAGFYVLAVSLSAAMNADAYIDATARLRVKEA